jgi:hypothetical protein
LICFSDIIVNTLHQGGGDDNNINNNNNTCFEMGRETWSVTLRGKCIPDETEEKL